MPKISSLKVDPKKEVEGVEVDFDGWILIIARAGNPRYVEERDRILEPIKKGFRRGNLPVDVVLKAQKKAAAKFILVGWRNLQDEDGVDIPYSSEKALEFFNDPEMGNFYDDVFMFASTQENYRKENIKEQSKNSPRSTGGKKRTGTS